MTTSGLPGHRWACMLAGFALSCAALASGTGPAPPATYDPHFVRGVPTIWLGDHYSVKGKRFDLVRRTDRLAIKLQQGDDQQSTLARLVRRGGPLAGFRQAAVMGDGVVVLESSALATQGSTADAYAKLQETLASLDPDAAIAWHAPVFVNVAFGTYAVVPDEIVVRLRADASAADVFADPRVADYRRADSSDAFIVRVADGPAEAALQLAASLQSHPKVLWSEPNIYQERRKFFTPDDPLLSAQWNLHNTGQADGTVGADARLFDAWDIAQSGGAGLTIAIVDDAPELLHPELAIAQNPGELAGNGIDDDNNGYVDDSIGWDFTGPGPGDNYPAPNSYADMHATSVAGVAAAIGNNGVGIAGAAFGARVMASRMFLGDTATNDANIASALAYAAGRGRQPDDDNWSGADVLNNSWGGGAPASIIDDAIAWASQHGRGGLGTPVIFSAGNGYTDYVAYPASLSGTFGNVIAVGASDNFDYRSYYSQFGPELDIVAPSSGGTINITTTDRLGDAGYDAGDYTYDFGGTSSAAPLVSGVSALLLAQDPSLTAAQVRTLLRTTAAKIGGVEYVDGHHPEYGYGRLDAAEALLSLGNTRVDVSLGGVPVQDAEAIHLAKTDPASQLLHFSIASKGTGELTIGDIEIAGDAQFTIEQGLSAHSLMLGETATFSIAFDGSQAGQFAATLSFQTNDPEHPTFTLPLEANVDTTVGGVLFEDWNGNGARDTGDLPVTNHLVFVDQNNDGQVSSGATQELSSDSDLGLHFGGNPQQIEHSIEVSGALTHVERVWVNLNMAHPFVGDVRIRLIAPNGQTVTLVDQPANGQASGDNFSGTVFDDSAPIPIDVGVAPYGDAYRPLEPLSTLAGIDANGSWTLEVTDLAPAQDDGVLVNWTLGLTLGNDPTTISDEDGRYEFASLPPGMHTIRSTDDDGIWRFTQPVGGSRTIQLDGDSLADLDFGLVRKGAIYGRVYGDSNANGVYDFGEPLLENETVVRGPGDGESINVLHDTMEAPWTIHIPDDDWLGMGAASTISRHGAEMQMLTDISVEIDITHPEVTELRVTLLTPSGTSIPLADGYGSGGANFHHTVFRDDATQSIAEAGAASPYTGAYRPIYPFSSADGEPTSGQWTLFVTDIVEGSVGTIDRWVLHMSFTPTPSTVTNAFGNYRFLSSEGTQKIYPPLLPGDSLTQPPEQHYLVTLDADDTAFGRDFGIRVVPYVPPLFSDSFED